MSPGTTMTSGLRSPPTMAYECANINVRVMHLATL